MTKHYRKEKEKSTVTAISGLMWLSWLIWKSAARTGEMNYLAASRRGIGSLEFRGRAALSYAFLI